MKDSKYTVHIVSETSEDHINFSVKGKHVKIGAWAAGGMILLTLIFGIIFVPRALKYDEIKQENKKLIKAKLKIARIINEYNEIVKMDSYIRNVLGSDLNLKKNRSQLDSLENSDIEKINRARENDSIKISYLDNLPIYEPVKGYVTQEFKKKRFFDRKNHYGIDVAAQKGEPVKAVASGRIIFSGWNTRYGYMTIISHSDGYFTVYGHHEKNITDSHQYVDRGDVIGYVGNTGISEGPHLHFEIWKNGEPLDPMRLIPSYTKKDISN